MLGRDRQKPGREDHEHGRQNQSGDTIGQVSPACCCSFMSDIFGQL
jgi:hypothetical protein